MRASKTPLGWLGVGGGCAAGFQWFRLANTRAAGIVVLFLQLGCPHYLKKTPLILWHSDTIYIPIWPPWFVSVPFPPMFLHQEIHYMSPKTGKGRPMECSMPNNYGLISNCLFLRIIPNGCAAKPLSTLAGIRAVWGLHFSCLCPQQRPQFWFDKGDWGIYQYIRNDTEVQQNTFPPFGRVILPSNRRSVQVCHYLS